MVSLHSSHCLLVPFFLLLVDYFRFSFFFFFCSDVGADFLLDLAYEGLNATTPVIDNLEDPYCHIPVSLSSPLLSSLLEDSSDLTRREEELLTRASSSSPPSLLEEIPQNNEAEVNVSHREEEEEHRHQQPQEKEDLISVSSLSSSTTAESDEEIQEKSGKEDKNETTRRRRESREGQETSRSGLLVKTQPPSSSLERPSPAKEGMIEEKDKKRENNNVAGVGSVLSLNLYLRMLIHLMGDIHQPLHTCLAFSPAFPTGDRFGTKVHTTLYLSLTYL